MAATGELAALVGIAPACSALGVPRASFYRNLAPPSGPAPARPRPVASNSSRRPRRCRTRCMTVAVDPHVIDDEQIGTRTVGLSSDEKSGASMSPLLLLK